MIQQIDKDQNTPSDRLKELKSNNILTGIFLFLIGAGIILKKMDTPIPDWIFSWEILIIGFGIYMAIRHNFKGPVWFILLLIGGLSLVDDVLPDLNVRQYSWPVILMVLGLYFILRPKGVQIKRKRHEDSNEMPGIVENQGIYDKSDWLEMTTILGGVKKIVVSKNFRGGEIVSFMGGAEINLSQADIHGRVRLEATNVMGGTKLIVPANWDVQSELVAIFGGVEDKRDLRSVTIDSNKILVLEGTCIFGGIEIKSY
ncbi:MAG: LiaF domain-containing protein [Bacteroidota bacterium]